MKKALILGITGQDGSYLAEILLSKGYEVHGMVRHTSLGNLNRINHLIGDITLHYGDMLDPLSVDRIVRQQRPDEVYNVADQDNVDFSFKAPAYSVGITTQSVVNLLESIKSHCPEARLFQPVSATMFGLSPAPQNEYTEFQPQSLYACSKLATYYVCQHYRREYGMFVSTGIMFNHDSPRRSDKYLLHKIAKQSVQVARGELKKVLLPVLDMQVDIGYAEEYMQAAHSMLQRKPPRDYVVATGIPYTICSLAQFALRTAGVQVADFPLVLDEDASLRRVGKQPVLVGDPKKARCNLEFKPKHNARTMVEMLTELEMKKCG